MLIDPRTRFAQSTHAAAFKKIVATPDFEEATLAALLSLQREMPIECNPQQSLDAHQQMVGARRYLEILCSLHEPVTQPKPAPKKGLDYSSGV